MTILLPVSRTCARQTLPFKTRPITPLQLLQSHLRTLTTSTQPQAQSIQIPSSTSSAAPTKPSPLVSNVLSRATTEPKARSQSSETSPQLSSPKTKSKLILPKSSPKSILKAQTPNFATVTRTGTMLGAVQLTARTPVFDKALQKHYTRPKRFLAHDPNPAGFLREGDVVQYSALNEAELTARDEKRQGIREKLVREGKVSYVTKRGKVRPANQVGLNFGGPEVVVRQVITPFGVGVEERLKV